MYTERMQLLLTREQRRRIEIEAKRRGLSASAVVREALDAQVDPISSERRLEALERLRRMRIPFIPIDELNALLDDRD